MRKFLKSFLCLHQATRIYNNWLNTGEVADAPRSGRPKVTSEKDEKMLIECAKDNPDMCVEQLLDKANLDISKTTGWRVLIANDYQYKTAETKWQ